jgi:PPE-repeat protein
MLKPILLATAMMISAPAIAQDMGAQESTMPGQETTAPEADAATQTAPDAALPETQQPMDSTDAQTAEPQATETPQTASADQIAQIVEAEFPTYDKSGTGEVNKVEFTEWMVALRSASEPGVDAQSAEVQGWVEQAFAQADTDSSDGVSKEELTAFLSQGA